MRIIKQLVFRLYKESATFGDMSNLRKLAFYIAEYQPYERIFNVYRRDQLYYQQSLEKWEIKESEYSLDPKVWTDFVELQRQLKRKV